MLAEAKVCIEGVILSCRLRCVCGAGTGPAGNSTSVGSGGLIETPESFLTCLTGLDGNGGEGVTSFTLTETSDLDEPDLRGFGRTMANCGDEALFRCTFLTTS